ncbi:type II toxin-antitoxin system RelE/ParE family toxin [Kiloniella sp. EL199]|uniref:type II toxin-antitoxin system RelE/ParE family toxin n=1 Tax=Kiloniella sp. EL199 TaxID=2107581 RepID=UPI000EA38C2F
MVFTPLAKRDLSDIWNYTNNQWGAKQADNYVRELYAAIERHREEPFLAKDISDVRSGYRKFLSGSHVTFFQQDKRVINVIRILHKSMDFDRHL